MLFDTVLLYFNPRSPRGERRGRQKWISHLMDYFNPRSPRGERHLKSNTEARVIYFNPRSPRGERLPVFAVEEAAAPISTLAPREGSDGSSMI